MRRGTGTGRWWRVLALVAAAVVLLGVDAVAADPAAADGAGPTRFASIIDSVEPDLDEVDVSIVGGDAFIQVRAEDGTEVAIAGYDGEPYLRIDPDGSIWENQRSPSVYLNATRGGSGGRFPQGVSSGAEPEWEQVGNGGVVAWHDHRIHWMLDEDPTVGADGLVQAWELPIDVDGTEVLVTGRLLLEGSVFPWAIGVALATGALAVFLGRNARGRIAVLAVASLAAVATSVAAFAVNPPRSGASVIPVALPVIAVLCTAAAWFTSPRRGEQGSRHGILTLAFPLGAVAALLGWVVQRMGVFWMANVPTELPVWVDRALTGLVLGAALGTAVAVLIRPVPSSAAPALDPPDGVSDAAQDSSTGKSPSSDQSEIPPRS